MSSEQLGLFDMEPVTRPDAGPRRKRWGGRASQRARATVRAMLPAPCTRCGGMISREDPEASWQADHIEQRAYGGGDAGNLGPAHSRCNAADGGRIGARMTNASRVTTETARERTAKWW